MRRSWRASSASSEIVLAASKCKSRYSDPADASLSVLRCGPASASLHWRSQTGCSPLALALRARFATPATLRILLRGGPAGTVSLRILLRSRTSRHSCVGARHSVARPCTGVRRVRLTLLRKRTSPDIELRIIRRFAPHPSRCSGHWASLSMLRPSPGWPSMATRSTHASHPLRAFYDAARRSPCFAQAPGDLPWSPA